jgi:hypothetical protein
VRRCLGQGGGDRRGSPAHAHSRPCLRAVCRSFATRFPFQIAGVERVSFSGVLTPQTPLLPSPTREAACPETLKGFYLVHEITEAHVVARLPRASGTPHRLAAGNRAFRPLSFRQEKCLRASAEIVDREPARPPGSGTAGSYFQETYLNVRLHRAWRNPGSLFKAHFAEAERVASGEGAREARGARKN